MAWLYKIISGGIYPASQAYLENPQALAFGYSGAEGKPQNNPEYVQVRDTGPIPPGLYQIQAPRDTDTHGPYVLPLEPDYSNKMYGRSSFLLHGDNSKGDKSASMGCIVMPRAVRTAVWMSEDHVLRVV